MDSSLLVACGFIGILFLALVYELLVHKRYRVRAIRKGSFEDIRLEFRKRRDALACMDLYTQPGWCVMLFKSGLLLEERDGT